MNTSARVKDFLDISEIVVEERARKDMGDIPAMVASIREFGIIQPIVINFDDFRLIAGGRRLEAMRQMGLSILHHGQEFVWKNEDSGSEEGKLRLKSMELEENLRRKDMAWPEVIAAKAELLRIMERIHGPQAIGGLTREAKRTGETEGFGVRKLAAMLGESPATVSQDLKLAAVVDSMPQLKTIQSKSVAQGQAMNMILAAGIKAGLIKPSETLVSAVGGQANTVAALQYRVVIHCKDEQDQATLLQEMAGRGYKVEAVIV